MPAEPRARFQGACYLVGRQVRLVEDPDWALHSEWGAVPVAKQLAIPVTVFDQCLRMHRKRLRGGPRHIVATASGNKCERTRIVGVEIYDLLRGDVRRPGTRVRSDITMKKRIWAKRTCRLGLAAGLVASMAAISGCSNGDDQGTGRLDGSANGADTSEVDADEVGETEETDFDAASFAGESADLPPCEALINDAEISDALGTPVSFFRDEVTPGRTHCRFDDDGDQVVDFSISVLSGEPGREYLQSEFRNMSILRSDPYYSNVEFLGDGRDWGSQYSGQGVNFVNLINSGRIVVVFDDTQAQPAPDGALAVAEIIEQRLEE